MAVDLTQSEIAFPEGSLASSPEAYFATRLIAQLQREANAERRFWIRATSRWLVAFEYVKELEDRLLMRGSDALQREKHFFASTVSILIGLGRLLHSRMTEAELSIDTLGMSMADFSACLEELVDIDRALHRERSPVVDPRMEALFGDGSPT